MKIECYAPRKEPIETLGTDGQMPEPSVPAKILGWLIYRLHFIKVDWTDVEEVEDGYRRVLTLSGLMPRLTSSQMWVAIFRMRLKNSMADLDGPADSDAVEVYLTSD